MANEEHLKLIKQGVQVWNEWRQENPHIAVNLFRANLEGLYLAGVDLRHADLRRAELSRSFLRHADLSDACLLGANLSQSDLKRAILQRAILRDANLSGADLSQANLSLTYLSDANLSNASLIDVQIDRTQLTGACIENWKVDNVAQLENAICEYVYLKQNRQECRPRLGTFEPGELVSLCQRMADIFELRFHQGLEWSALLAALRYLTEQPGLNNVRIRGLEQADDGSMILVLQIPPFADRDDLRKQLLTEYQRQLKALDQKYLTQGITAEKIEQFRQSGIDLAELFKFLATRTLTPDTW